MAKKILISLVFLLIFFGAALYMFRNTIKDYGLKLILRSFPIPNVAMADVNFDKTKGTLNLADIKVKNPKGFHGKYIMEADSIDMKLNIATKPSLRLDINNIDIKNPVFYIERSTANHWNFQEFEKKNNNNPSQVSIRNNDYFSFMKDAYAEETATKPKVSFPSTINIKNGTIHYLDNYILPGRGHHIDIFPVTGIVSLTRSAAGENYEKISFNGFANMNGKSEQAIKGNFEVFPSREKPDYSWQFTASDIPLPNLKPYLDQYTPFLVTQGTFNFNSELKAAGGSVDGTYTMEIEDLVFYLNPDKANIPFLETSVQKLTMYLTNQSGNVVIDFRQKTDANGNIKWGLGPIAKRAIGMMAIDTVIDIIQKTQNAGNTGDILKQSLPKDIPPEVIDIFKGIMR